MNLIPPARTNQRTFEQGRCGPRRERERGVRRHGARSRRWHSQVTPVVDGLRERCPRLAMPRRTAARRAREKATGERSEIRVHEVRASIEIDQEGIATDTQQAVSLRERSGEE